MSDDMLSAQQTQQTCLKERYFAHAFAFYAFFPNLPDKEREARFKFNQLPNAAQQTPTLRSGSRHIRTNSDRLHETLDDFQQTSE